MSADEKKRLLRYLIDEGLNKGDFSIIDEHVDENYTAHIPRLAFASGRPTGTRPHARRLRAVRSGAPRRLAG
jgi:hypothetical protein